MGRKKSVCKKQELEETKKVITESFKVLCCSEMACTPGLKPTPFLRDYFNKHCNKIYFLPKRAFQKELKDSLPEQVVELRAKLAAIK